MILVTGAAGYLGNNTVRRLIEQGHHVRAMVHNRAKAEIRLANYKDQIEIVEGDVRDKSSLVPLLEGVTAVIHYVAIPMERKGQRYEDVNYRGTVNLVDAASDVGVQRFINMSQNGASGSVPYRFLKSKGMAQEYVAASNLQWTALRPSAIFGPQDEFFNSIARLVKLTPIFFPLIGGGSAEFQPVSVHDVVEAAVQSLENEATIGKELTLGGPEVLTLGEIERRIIEVLETRRIMIPAPTGILRVPVWLMQRLLPGSPVNTSLLDLLAVPNTTPDNALINVFDMDPTPFSGEHITYLKDNPIGETLRKFLTGDTVK